MGFRHLALVEPLGLETVAGGLDGHEVRLLDLRVEGGLLDTLRSFRPDLCGISCSFTVDRDRVLRAAEAMKSVGHGPGPYVVVGGHHASLNPGDFNSPTVDAIVRGEGEETLPELAACLEEGGDVRSVPGLVLNVGGGQLPTEARQLAHNLDDLPLPARDLTHRHRTRYYLGSERPMAVVETARGCPYRCKFCSVWQFHRGRYRAKSPGRVGDEVAATAEPYVLFTDDNFLADIERARQTATILRERGLQRRYAFQARSDSIVAYPDVVDLWRQVGLVSVFVGIEKIDDAGLSSVNKENSVVNNEKALQLLRRLGVAITASFIVDPGWRQADFDALRRYIASLGIQTPSFTVLTPLPGTSLYRQLREHVLTEDCELFDLLHAVIPTSLVLSDFYAEMAGLYRSAYSRGPLLVELLRVLWGDLSRGNLSLFHMRRLAEAARTLTDARYYLAGHGALTTSS